MATTNIPMDRELVAECRKLAGVRTNREAMAEVARDFIRHRRAELRSNGQVGTGAESETEEEYSGRGFDSRPRPGQTKAERLAEQDRLMKETYEAVVARGDPFYPGYDPRKLREDEERKTRERWGDDWPWPEPDSAK